MISEVVTWMVTASVLYVVSSTFVLFRLYHRHRRSLLRISDYVTLVMLVLSTFFFAINVNLGYCILLRPVSTTPLQKAIAAYLTLIATRLTIPLIKVSVLLLYLEIAQNVWHKRYIKLLIAFILVTMTVLVFLGIFGCILQDANGHIWSVLYPAGLDEDFDSAAAETSTGHSTLEHHKCLPQESIVLATAAVNVASELFILILSLPFVYKIKATRVQKIGLSSAFLVGFFTIAASITASLIFSQAYFALLNGKFDARGFFIADIWSMTELNSGLIFTNLLPVRSILLDFLGRRLRVFLPVKDWLSASSCTPHQSGATAITDSMSQVKGTSGPLVASCRAASSTIAIAAVESPVVPTREIIQDKFGAEPHKTSPARRALEEDGSILYVAPRPFNRESQNECPDVLESGVNEQYWDAFGEPKQRVEDSKVVWW